MTKEENHLPDHFFQDVCICSCAECTAHEEQARAEGPFAQMAVDQRIADNLPCPACGGDRLRPRFDGPGLCHAGGLELTKCVCPGCDSLKCGARTGVK